MQLLLLLHGVPLSIQCDCVVLLVGTTVKCLTRRRKRRQLRCAECFVSASRREQQQKQQQQQGYHIIGARRYSHLICHLVPEILLTGRCRGEKHMRRKAFERQQFSVFISQGGVDPPNTRGRRLRYSRERRQTIPLLSTSDVRRSMSFYM